MRSLLFLFLVLGAWPHVLADSQSGVQVSLFSTWGSTSFQSETSEFLADIAGNHAFWGFIQQLSTIFHHTGATPKEWYNWSLSAASNVTDSQFEGALKLALDLHFYSPLVSMYRNTGDNILEILEPDEPKSDCWFWVVHGNDDCGTIAHTKEELEKNLVKRRINSCNEIENLQHLFHLSDPNVRRHEYKFQSSSQEPSGSTVIFYAKLGSESFSALHSAATDMANRGLMGRYLFRHYDQSHSPKLNIQGYGAVLQLKNMEYKAIDDSKISPEEKAASETHSDEGNEQDIEGFYFERLMALHPGAESKLHEFKASLLEATAASLRPWELADLGIQASQRILKSANPLSLLRDLSQNFPSLAVSLSKLRVNPAHRARLAKLTKFVPHGTGLLYINGYPVELKTVNMFELFNFARGEVAAVSRLKSFGIPSAMSIRMLKIDSRVERGGKGLKINVANSLVDFVNDMERDAKMYAKFSKSLKDVFEKDSSAGEWKAVQKNLITAEIVVDPGTIEGLVTIAMAANAIQQGLPIRHGFLFNCTTDLSKSIFRLWKHTIVSKGPWVALSFFSQVLRYIYQSGNVDLEIFELMWGSLSEIPFQRVVQDTRADSVLAETDALLTRLGVAHLTPPYAFVNGELVQGNVIENISQRGYSQYGLLEELYKQEKIIDTTDVYSFLLSRPDVFPSFKEDLGKFATIPRTPLEARTARCAADFKTPDCAASHLEYFKSHADESFKGISTHLVVADVMSPKFRKFFKTFLEFLQSDEGKKARATVVNSRMSLDAPTVAALLALREAAKETAVTARMAALEAVVRVLNERAGEYSQAGASKPGLAALSADLMAALASAVGQHAVRAGRALVDIAASPEQFQREYVQLTQQAAYVHSVLPGKDLTCSLGINGKFMEAVEAFAAGELAVLQSMSTDPLFEALSRELEKHHSQSDLSAREIRNAENAFMDAYNFLSTKQYTLRQPFPVLLPPHLILTQNGDSVKIAANDEEVPVDVDLHVQLVVDPLSANAQRSAVLVARLLQDFNARLDLFLNPVTRHEKLPLESYYRTVLSPTTFTPAGQPMPTGAFFQNLPVEQLLTLSLDTPESWLALPVKALYDSDNIRLSELPQQRCSVVFELQHILVQGSAVEPKGGDEKGPPQGLQLVLKTTAGQRVTDTLVMANLGYFQLKANPAAWFLDIASGRHSTIYELSSLRDSSDTSKEVTRSDQGSTLPLAVASFLGPTYLLSVKKREGKEKEVLLMDSWITDENRQPVGGEEDDSFLSRLWRFGQDEPKETIHIFSVASGHLYERFLKIMMLSVLKHTTAHVHFHLLGNYLSPKFKDFIPTMAKHYKFSYSLVQYQWPSWLRQQTQKQRIIWGYKILFLDVLFPLTVDRIIFVDADQVVRADMMELMNMDLKGKVYGYVPFCKSRTEMAGFRFWDSGYWKTHLGTLPYHISALYVVDLKRFRLTAAGDSLRAIYDSLSRDPNSLSNLDQDLPNYLQHQIPIFSLPQEWLWCETWCDDASKAKAKTIDLCNNPMTKTPKLDNALRIIEEWKALDDEISELAVPAPASSDTTAANDALNNARTVLQ